ncbi:MAG: filamentous hemagglutinin N-terminal domain-containing protein, partial [Burkholderiales bacterium]
MKAKRVVTSLLRRRALVVAVASCFAGYAQANPTSPTVISGAATFAASGKSLTVTNTPGAIINWQGFSVKADELTRFIQQNAQSAVLNRVIGQEQSAILGQLQSNGRVYLINPNGITVGASARIDTAGFVASSLNLSDRDALAGKFKLQDTGSSGKVINNGTITTTSGGFVYLVAPDVENNGIITSPKGEIILAAGKSVELVDSQQPELRVQLTAPENTAINVGKMIAEAGSIGIFAGAIRQSGQVSANTAVVGENGKIIFKATKDVTLAAGSSTTANGPSDGSIKIQSDTGAASIAGVVEANGTQGKGGSISVTAPVAVTVAPTARVSANGTEGGSVTLASSAGSVTVAAPVSANATSGVAGQVAVNAATSAALTAGQLSASGGQGSGAVSLRGSGGVTFDTSSSAQASGATGGTVSIASDQGAIAAQGTIDVSGTNGVGGNVKLTAQSDITLDIANKVLASGRSGGEVYIESGEGTLLASGSIDGRGSDGRGGRVLLLAPRVGLIREAEVNVSGRTGGGIALVGGNFHGAGPEQNASATYVAAGASINADATGSGDGGNIAIWSQDVTRVYGSVSARGGAAGGNGGFVETSSHNQLDVTGMQLDLRAPLGRGGNWLLDPWNVTITTGGTASIDVPAGPTFTPNATGANIDVATIEGQLNGGTSVTITTADANGLGGDAGNITLTPAISKTTGLDASLTMIAAGTITTTGAISSTSNKLNVTMRANDNTAGQNDQNTAVGDVLLGGAVTTNGGFFQGSGVNFNNTGGAITTANGNVTLTQTGNVTIGAAVNTGTGTLATSGVNFNNTGGAITTTGAGNVTLTHTGSVTLGAAMTVGGDVTIIGNSIDNPTVGAANITSNTLNLAATTTIGATNPIDTTVSTIDAVAGGNIRILEANAVTLDTVTSGGSIDIANAAAFDITLGTATGGIVSAATGVTLSIGGAGSIVDGTSGFTNISVPAGQAVVLNGMSTNVTVGTSGTVTGSAAGATTTSNITVGALTSVGDTIRVYSPGNLTANGTIAAVGGVQLNAAGAVAVNAAVTTSGGNFTSTTAQSFSSNGAGTITTTAAANSGTASGAVTITTSAAAGINLAGDIVTTGAANNAAAASAGGQVDLTANSGTVTVANITTSGGVATGAFIGGTGGAVNVTSSGGATTLSGATIDTSGGAGTPQGAGGNVTFNSAVVLGGAETISTGATAGNILFSSTLDGTTANTETLGLTAGTGNVTFSNTVGATKAL